MQPPSGGCVLKQWLEENQHRIKKAATFGWLCVETAILFALSKADKAATFGWLCIETKTSKIIHAVEPAATFGRLCVETLMNLINYSAWLSSRLQAAVC